MPVADFAADVTLGVAPLTVQFTDTSAGNTTSWVWNFSDGPQSIEQHPAKTFDTPGLYDITLVARGPTGVDTLVRTGHIEVVAGPWAAFGASPRSGDCPLAVQFEDRSLGAVTTWSWDFGDGTGSTERNPAHVYLTPGTYTVALRARSPMGTGTHTRSQLVAVSRPTLGGALPRPNVVLIVLDDIGVLRASDAATLRAWAEKGGVVIRFAGPTLAEAAQEGTPPLLPVTLRGGGRAFGGALTWETPQKLGAFAKDGPFADLVPPTDVFIRRQVLAEPGGETTAKSWASLSDGTPLVTAAVPTGFTLPHAVPAAGINPPPVGVQTLITFSLSLE